MKPSRGTYEDETRSVRSNHVDKLGTSSDVTSNDTVSLSKCTSDDIDSIHNRTFLSTFRVDFEIEVFSDTSASWSIHSNGVYFIEESDGTVFLGQIADLGNGSHGSRHGVNRFESDNLGSFARD